MKRKNRHTPSAAKVGRFIGHAIDSAVGTATDTVSHAFTSTLRLAGLSHHSPDGTRPVFKPGGIPGMEGFDVNTPPEPDTVHFHVHDYGPDSLVSHQPTDLAELLATPRPDNVSVRWINIDGLHPWVVKRFTDAYNLHTLAGEDTLHVPQRPKAERYDDHLYAVGRMMRIEEGKLVGEQVSFFLKPGLLITFQEHRGDLWEPIRERLQADQTRMRKSGSDYLMYALLDAMVDHCFPVLERFGDMLEELELEVLENPSPAVIQNVYAIKRELNILRRVLWPTRELINVLMDEQTAEVTDPTRLFMRDAQEHCVQLVEIIETFRETASSLTDLHMSAISNRMNEVMKFLTILGALFIPITFLAGIYGMNFEYIPELSHPRGYFVFWGVCITITIGLLTYFRRKGWLG